MREMNAALRQPALEPDLSLRLAAATPADTVRGMIFNGVGQAVESVAGTSAAQGLLAGRKSAKWVDFFSYSITDYLELAWAAADVLAPKVGGRDAAFFKLGHHAATSFLVSPVGRTLITLAGLDPRRMLSNISTAYRMCVSYGERKLVWTGPTEGRVEFRRDFLTAAFHCGAMQAAMEQAGGKDVKVTGTRLGPLDVDYVVRWA